MVDITGKKDAIDKRNEYQDALDYVHKEVKDKIHWLYKMNHKLKYALSDTQKYKKNIIADGEEKLELYAILNNLLVKETDFEKEMFKTSQKGKKNTKVIIKPKIKDSEVDNFRINAVQEYLDKYPEYASKSSFKKIIDKISDVEAGIKKTKKRYSEEVSKVLRELSYFPRNIQEAEDLIKIFKIQLKEGNEKLKSMRYLKSIAYRLASEKEKKKVTIHTLYYRMEKMENTIKTLKMEVSKTKRQDLEEMDY